MDALNFTLTLDNFAAGSIETLAPHMSAFTLKSPRTMDNAMEIPKPVAGNIAEWLEMDEDHIVEPYKLQKMQTLLAA